LLPVRWWASCPTRHSPGESATAGEKHRRKEGALPPCREIPHCQRQSGPVSPTSGRLTAAPGERHSRQAGHGSTPEKRFQFVPCEGCINLRGLLRPVMGGEGSAPSPASSRHGSCRRISCRQAAIVHAVEGDRCCRKSRQHPVGTQQLNHGGTELAFRPSF
jgi:hypothetical protein